MKISTSLLVALVLLVARNCDAFTLDFPAPIPGSINDVHGIWTGFTTRLPGTGSAIPANDPNMDLLAVPGKLLLTSTHADINQSPGPTGTNLPNFEAPGIVVPGIGTSDFVVKATFENVHVPNGGDHLMVYAGVNENLIISGGVHEKNVYLLSRNSGSGDVNISSADGSFTPGDNIEIALARHSGVWTLSWMNLTNATSGMLPTVSFPQMDGQSDLYCGIYANNPGTVPGKPIIQSFVAQIDKFSVDVLPEPASVALCLIGCAFATFARRRWHI